MVSDTSTLDSDDCNQNAESALVFGLGSLDNTDGAGMIVSRSVKTIPLSLSPGKIIVVYSCVWREGSTITHKCFSCCKQ